MLPFINIEIVVYNRKHIYLLQNNHKPFKLNISVLFCHFLYEEKQNITIMFSAIYIFKYKTEKEN